MAQSEQSLGMRYLTESVNAWCQAISHSSTIDFAALIGTLSDPTLFVRKPIGPFLTNGCRLPDTTECRCGFSPIEDARDDYGCR